MRLAARLFDPEAFVIGATMPKTHDYAVVSMSVKNMVLGAPLHSAPTSAERFNHKQSYHAGYHLIHYNMLITAQSMAPHWGVAVVDAFEGMEGNGPVGGTPVESKAAIASTDFIAADRVGVECMGIDPDWIGYLRYGHQMGLGNYDLARIDIRGVPIASVRQKYQLPGDIQRQLQWMEPLEVDDGSWIGPKGGRFGGRPAPFRGPSRSATSDQPWAMRAQSAAASAGSAGRRAVTWPWPPRHGSAGVRARAGGAACVRPPPGPDPWRCGPAPGRPGQLRRQANPLLGRQAGNPLEQRPAHDRPDRRHAASIRQGPLRPRAATAARPRWRLDGYNRVAELRDRPSGQRERSRACRVDSRNHGGSDEAHATGFHAGGDRRAPRRLVPPFRGAGGPGPQAGQDHGHQGHADEGRDDHQD